MMENYNLMWGDFTSNLSLTVKDLRNDADFLDVSIACEDDTIDAHKVILSACSNLFKQMLRYVIKFQSHEIVFTSLH